MDKEVYKMRNKLYVIYNGKVLIAYDLIDAAQKKHREKRSFTVLRAI